MRVPLMLGRYGGPLRRDFLRVDDLVSARLAALDTPSATRRLFNISMNQPMNYGRAAALLMQTGGLERVDIAISFRSNWISNARAWAELVWHPLNDLEVLIERAWSFERSSDEPRRIWYPG